MNLTPFLDPVFVTPFLDGEMVTPFFVNLNIHDTFSLERFISSETRTLL